jgi:RNA polymerase sigma factor (sigma-70 family)
VRADAFESVFERHFDAVYGYLARRVGPDVGRDLASETFTRAFAARKRFDPERGEVRGWLFGIAHNLLRRHYRDEERRLRALARPDAARRPVGSGIATLQLRYQDGRVVRVALYGEWALYEIKRADYAVGRRPEVLIGRDAAGRLIASSRLPWAIR